MSESTLEAPLTSTTVSQSRPLTGLDRCDRCGAQAYVHLAVVNTALDLMFCGHHYRTVQDNPQFTLIRNELAKLTERPVYADDAL